MSLRWAGPDAGRHARRPSGEALAGIRLRVQAGLPVQPPAEAPPRLRRAIAFAASVGAPMLPSLDAAAAAADDLRVRAEAIEVATAQPRAAARFLLALPWVVAGLISGLTGTGPATLLGDPMGRTVLVVVLVLLLGGWFATRGVVARVSRLACDGSTGGPSRADAEPVTGDEVVELLATGMAAGLSPPAALRAVGDVVPALRPTLARAAASAELGVPVVGPGGAPRAGSDGGRHPDLPLDAVRRAVAVLQDAAVLGAPGVQPLRDLARALRQEEQANALARVQRAPVLLAVPTALLLLPATVLLAGAPLVLQATQDLDAPPGVTSPQGAHR